WLVSVAAVRDGQRRRRTPSHSLRSCTSVPPVQTGGGRRRIRARRAAAPAAASPTRSVPAWLRNAAIARPTNTAAAAPLAPAIAAVEPERRPVAKTRKAPTSG